MAAENWSANMEGNLRYRNAFHPQENKADLPDYLFTAQWGSTQMQLGDVIVDESQLAAPNLGRRGVKVTLPIALLRSELHAFVTQTENRAGLRNALRLAEAKNRLYGIALHVTPLTDAQTLRMRGLYLSGKASGLQSPNIGSAEGIQEGQSWTWGLASTLFRERLQIEFENSWTRFDTSVGDFVGPDHDSAWRGQVRWIDDMFSLAESPVQISLLSGYDRIGTHYRTVANPGMVADREGVNATLGATWRSLTLSLGGAAFRDNVGLAEALPRTTDLSSTATLAVNAPELPTLGLTYTRTIQKSSHQPKEFGVPRVDNTLDRIALTVGYPRDTWSVDLGLGFTTLDDKTQKAPTQIADSQTWDITLGGSWTPSLLFSLSPSLSLFRRIDKNRMALNAEDIPESRRITTDTIFLSLTTSWTLVPDQLTLDLQGASGYNRASDGSTESTNVDGSLQLSWNVEKYLWQRGKQILLARGTLSWQRDNPSHLEQLAWGVFVGLNVFFPVSVESIFTKPPVRSARLALAR
jgi:hypothetical protein